MIALWIALAILVLSFAMGLAGLYLQTVLPESHSVSNARDIIGSVFGLINFLLALVRDRDLLVVASVCGFRFALQIQRCDACGVGARRTGGR